MIGFQVMKLLLSSSCVWACLLLGGCASFSPPKPILSKLPEVKLPAVPKPGSISLNPFARRESAAVQTAATTSENGPQRGVVPASYTNPLMSAPGLAATLIGSTPDAAKSQASLSAAERVYQQAQQAQGEQRVKSFAQAAPDFARAAERAVDDNTKEKARFLAAESYFFADDYPKAVEAQSKLLKEFPNTNYLDTIDKRRFGIAQYWIGVEKQDSKYDILPNFTNDRRPVADTFGNAIKLFDRIRYDNPNGKLADDATMAAAAGHFERGRFGEANELFDDLRENFPSSEHQFRAHLLGLKAKMKVYAGPDYDGGILDEAEELCRRVVVAFPHESREEREYLENELKNIRLKKAEREYTLARYYDRRAEYSAAEIHYGNVARDFHDTNLAAASKTRIGQLEQLPPEHKQSLQWLADAFPKEYDPQPLLSRHAPPPLIR